MYLDQFEVVRRRVAVLRAEGAPLGGHVAVHVLYKVTDVLVGLVDVHSHHYLCAKGFGNFKEFNDSKGVGGVRVESVSEAYPPLVKRAYHLLPPVEVGVNAHVNHGSVVTDYAYALLLERVDYHLAHVQAVHAAPFARLHECEAQFNLAAVLEAYAEASLGIRSVGGKFELHLLEGAVALERIGLLREHVAA